MSFFSQSGHWYTVTDGTIASAHDLDLRSARLVNAFPSITTVLKERANGALDTWKQDQLFQAMVAHPYKGDNLEQYKRFISELASKKGTSANPRPRPAVRDCAGRAGGDPVATACRSCGSRQSHPNRQE